MKRFFYKHLDKITITLITLVISFFATLLISKYFESDKSQQQKDALDLISLSYSEGYNDAAKRLGIESQDSINKYYVIDFIQSVNKDQWET